MSSYSSETPGRGGRSRFVTLCQQLLALAVVIAVLTPAARTVTMDVRPVEPADVVPGDMDLRAAGVPSRVPTKPVEPEVEEYPLTAPAGVRARVNLRATAKAANGRGRSITSEALPVDGYGTVGVTWSREAEVDHDGIDVRVRTRIDGEWTGWTTAEYHDEHAPDPRSEEATRARPGTDALLVGDVEAVQVKVDTAEAAPADMRLAVIDPGKEAATAKQQPAIDTGRLASRDASAGEGDADGAGEGDGDLSLQAGTFTPRPKIYSRAQWGADERLRDKGSLSYYEVQGGYVHHTVNANDYSSSQVPGIIRGIYSYHTRSRGWSDIGYNFLVDKFGRVWEGRAGGVDRPVVGAHTSGYNQHSFAMSAIGNFDKARPTSDMLRAYGSLFAWKLALHGVDAADRSVRIGDRSFPAISGHRDAGSTACPGRYLYEKLYRIRELADDAQRSFHGRELEQHYAGGSTNDLLVRRASDGRIFTFALELTSSGWKIKGKYDTGVNAAWAQRIYKAGDWDRDGYNDFIARRRSDGALLLYRGKGGNKFQAPVMLTNLLSKVGLLTSPGDVTGDGRPDLMAQPTGGRMRIYPGKGAAGLGTREHNLAQSYGAYNAVTGSAHIPAGLVNGDGALDSIIRSGSTVRLYYGNGPGGWTSGKTLEVSAGGYDQLVGVGRLGKNRQPDFVARSKETGRLYILPGTTSGWGKRIQLNTLSYKHYNLMA